MFSTKAARHLLLTAITLWLVSHCVSAVPAAPNVTFTVHPDPAYRLFTTPTATPLVLSSTSAFVCYFSRRTDTSYCQFVSPSNPSYSAPRVQLNVVSSNARFDQTPLPISPDSALYSSSGGGGSSGSFYAFSSSELATLPMNRYGATAGCATDPNSYTAFVPINGNATDETFIVATDATHIGTPLHTKYTVGPWAGVNAFNQSLMNDVVLINGQLAFMHNNTFHSYSADDGALAFSLFNPCNVAQTGEVGIMKLAKRAAEDGLDALIIFGNTTSASGAPEFTVCRISPDFGSMMWKYVMQEGVFVVNDIIGGSGVVLISGFQPGLNGGVMVLILDATQGISYGAINRDDADFTSTPAFIPQSVLPLGCGPGIALQKNLNLTVYCLNPILGNKTVRENMQAYSVAVQCNHRPLYDPISAQIVCVQVASSTTSVIASNGALVWEDTTRQLMTQPLLMIELGVSYAFILDVDATLYGYQIPLVAPTLAPQTLPPFPPSSRN